MSRVHLKLDGTWAECHAVQRACPRAFHLADMTLADTEVLPDSFIERLISPFDAPKMSLDIRAGLTAQFWSEADGRIHRDYGLPAVLYSDGSKAWLRHGKLHRVGGPALENPSGQRLWSPNLNEDGGLDTVYTDSFREWWVDGKLVKYENVKPRRRTLSGIINSAEDDIPPGVEYVQRDHF